MRFITDLIEARKKAGEKPTVGPYETKKVDEKGDEFTVTTEVWELEVAEAIFKFPKPRLSKKAKAELAKKSEEERADLAKLGRFHRAKARGIGDYLTMDRYACEVMLLEGLMPTITPDREASDFVSGTVRIRCKVVTSTTGPDTLMYLFVKIHPSTAKPTERLFICKNDPAEDDLVGLSDEETKKREAAIARREADKENCRILFGTDSVLMMVGLIPQKE